MNSVGKPVVDNMDFELWSFAVSAINACGLRIQSHKTTIRGHDLPTEQVQAPARIAAVVDAAAMEGERCFDAVAAEA